MEIREKELDEIWQRVDTIYKNIGNYNKVANSVFKVKMLVRKIRRRNGRG